MDSLHPFIDNDEISRLNKNNEVEFGRILEYHDAYGTYRVDWRSSTGENIAVENAFKPDTTTILVDRQHSEGGCVTHMTKNIVGDIIRSHHTVTGFLPYHNLVLENIPLDLLIPLTCFNGELLYADGWLGKVSSVEHLVTLKYDDEAHCRMLTKQILRTNMSFGYTKFSKCIASHTGQRIIPTNKEYETAEWLGVGMMENLNDIIFDHRGQEGLVTSSVISKIFVKWLCPMNPQLSLPKPARIIDDFDKICLTKDFDLQFKNWFKLHSFNRYTLREEDEMFDAEDLKDRFIHEDLLQKDDTRSKKAKIDSKRSPTFPKPLSDVYLEVIRVHQLYEVLWDDDDETTSLVLGKELFPYQRSQINRIGFGCLTKYDREIITTKPSFRAATNEVYGVTQHRFLIEDIVIVDFFQENGKKEITFLERIEISRFELISHPRYGKLKPGSIISLKETSTADSDNVVGQVIRVNYWGQIEAHLGEYNFVNTTHLFSPSQLVVKDLPDEDTFIEESSTTLNSLNPHLNKLVQFAEAVANDLKELQEVNPNGIKIKTLSNSLNEYSVLIVGPEDTPYENGLFIFTVKLPSAYPYIAPSIKLTTVPIGKEFLSFSLTPDGEVLHPMLSNFVPGDYNEDNWGWKHKTSLLNFLQKIREDVFIREPLFNKSTLKFNKNKDRLPADDNRVLCQMTSLNAGVIITTFDLLTSIKESPPDLWIEEINDHYEKVVPRMMSKFNAWLQSPLGALRDLRDFPKYHTFPLSIGFSMALTRRVNFEEKKKPST